MVISVDLLDQVLNETLAWQDLPLPSPRGAVKDNS